MATKLDIVLSVSGGGILGVGPAHFLARLEKDLGKKLNIVFNGMGGASTGAIIAGAVNEGISATEIENLYKKKGKSIFKEYSAWEKAKSVVGESLPKYDNTELKKMLKDMLKGACSEWKKEIFIPSVDMISIKNPEKVFDRGDTDIPKWFAVLASTCAPTYFMPAGSDKNWIDGGMVANNPIAITAAGYKKKTGKTKFKVIHLETGMLINRKGEGGNKSLIKWGTYVLENFVARSETTNTYIAKALVGDENVFVCQPVVEHGFPMDDLSHIDEIVEIWDKYYNEVGKDLIAFINK